MKTIFTSVDYIKRQPPIVVHIFSLPYVYVDKGLTELINKKRSNAGAGLKIKPDNKGFNNPPKVGYSELGEQKAY